MGLELTKALGPVIGSVLGPTLAGLFGPEGQDLSSFAGHGSADPITSLQNANTILGRIGQGVTDRAASPISLPSSYVQQPPVFTGGGMPMPIGVVGQDPALANPSLLNLQGMDQFKDIFKGLSTYSTPGTGTPPSGGTPGSDNPFTPPEMNGVPGLEAPGNGGVPGNYPVPGSPPGDDTTIDHDKPGASYPEFTRRRQPAQLVRGADLLQDDGGGDDLHRAIGAAKLLLQSFSADGGGGNGL
jgi:hypothetical protein